MRTFLIVALLSVCACHTMHFQITDEYPHDRVHERKAFFLWGLAPTQRIDLHEKCPAGVMSVMEETTFGDGLLGLLTLGIYSPRTSIYQCRPEVESRE